MVSYKRRKILARSRGRGSGEVAVAMPALLFYLL